MTSAISCYNNQNNNEQKHDLAQEKSGKDYSCYMWYGKRFDWILDLYSKNPNQKEHVPLFIREIGEGKDTILVIHGGFGMEHSYMMDALLPLADKVHFIFYDQRGSLRSPCPDSLISFAAHVDDVERIRKSFQLRKVNIIAHSMGTLIAMSYLQKYPETTGRLILLSSIAVKNDDANEKKRWNDYKDEHFNKKIFPQQIQYWIAALRQYGLDTAAYRQKRREGLIKESDFMKLQLLWSASGKISNYQNWDKDMTGSGFLFSNRAANAIWAQKDRPDSWNFTSSIKNHTSPIIFIKGSGDYLSPQLLKDQLPKSNNIKYIEIENAGHNIWIEQEKKFKEIMLKYIYDK
ncbi:MAG: alpha/beta hydrolase [Bacteroidota bacterium]